MSEANTQHWYEQTSSRLEDVFENEFYAIDDDEQRVDLLHRTSQKLADRLGDGSDAELLSHDLTNLGIAARSEIGELKLPYGLAAPAQDEFIKTIDTMHDMGCFDSTPAKRNTAELSLLTIMGQEGVISLQEAAGAMHDDYASILGHLSDQVHIRRIAEQCGDLVANIRGDSVDIAPQPEEFNALRNSIRSLVDTDLALQILDDIQVMGVIPESQLNSLSQRYHFEMLRVELLYKNGQLDAGDELYKKLTTVKEEQNQLTRPDSLIETPTDPEVVYSQLCGLANVIERLQVQLADTTRAYNTATPETRTQLLGARNTLQKRLQKYIDKYQGVKSNISETLLDEVLEAGPVGTQDVTLRMLINGYTPTPVDTSKLAVKRGGHIGTREFRNSRNATLERTLPDGTVVNTETQGHGHLHVVGLDERVHPTTTTRSGGQVQSLRIDRGYLHDGRPGRPQFVKSSGIVMPGGLDLGSVLHAIGHGAGSYNPNSEVQSLSADTRGSTPETLLQKQWSRTPIEVDSRGSATPTDAKALARVNSRSNSPEHAVDILERDERQERRHLSEGVRLGNILRTIVEIDPRTREQTRRPNPEYQRWLELNAKYPGGKPRDWRVAYNSEDMQHVQEDLRNSREQSRAGRNRR